MKYSIILSVLSALLFVAEGAFAQVRAYTEDGIQVLLYPDGTWSASRDPFGSDYGRRPDIVPFDPNESRVDILGGDLKSVEIMIRGEIIFVLKNGYLDNIRIIDPRGYQLFDMKTGEAVRTARNNVIFDRNRIVRYGRYDFKYAFHDGVLERVGPYDIEYEFPNNKKVERIGNLKIEYDFFTDRIERIGGVRLHFDGIRGPLDRVSGSNEGVILTFF